MSKKILWFFILIFCLSIIGAFFWYFLQEKQGQAHFYLGAEGGNAQVYLNQIMLGAAPIKDYTLPGGWYELNLITDYYTYTTPLRLTPLTATIVDWKISDNIDKSSGAIYELIPLEDDASVLDIVTIPDRANLLLDEQTDSSYSPHQFSTLAPGDHQIKVSLPGYQNQTVPFTLTPGYQLKLTIKLAQDSP